MPSAARRGSISTVNGCVSLVSPTVSRAWYCPGGRPSPDECCTFQTNRLRPWSLVTRGGAPPPPRPARPSIIGASGSGGCCAAGGAPAAPAPPPPPRPPLPPPPPAAGAFELYEFTVTPAASRISIVTGPCGSDGRKYSIVGPTIAAPVRVR